VSAQGLNAYGAVTWGQFFVYQGFNDRIGWMHTSSGVDNIDEYLETVTQREGHTTYRYGTANLLVTIDTITVPYRTATGKAERRFTVYRTQHGPVVRKVGEQWVSVRLMNDPLNALIQSYTRTKARDYRAFRHIMDLHTNSSNNTIFASADGDIAYFHANFIPRRDTAFDRRRRLPPTSVVGLPRAPIQVGPAVQSPGRSSHVPTVVTQKHGCGWGSSTFSALRTATSGALARLCSISGIGSAIGNASPSRNMIRSSREASCAISIAMWFSLPACEPSWSRMRSK